ncbi:MAG: replicative DNA helicase [Methyloceanibacter sp.]
MDRGIKRIGGSAHDGNGERGSIVREVPVNLEAEQALLGAILANNLSYDRVSDFLHAEHFADSLHSRIFEACTRLIERGQVANAVTLKNLFEHEGSLGEIGGPQYLARLQSSYVTIINVADYGRTILDLYLRRQLIDLGAEVVNRAFEHDFDLNADQQIEAAEQDLYNLAETGDTESGFQSFETATKTAIQIAEAAHRRDGGITGLSTGFDKVDELLGGLHPSDLIIVAGRPSMGKTAFATNIAYSVVATRRQERGPDGTYIEQDQIVAFFSLEMSAEQLATRIIASEANVRADALRRGEVRDQFEKVLTVARGLERRPLFIDDTPALSIAALRTRARRLKRQHGLSLIVVDYLQLMQPAPGRRSENRVQEVSEITRGLKAIAKELNVPVIALSQLSRQTEQRDDKRPQLSDLRESGSIEQDADQVIFLYREEYYKAREKPSRRADEEDDAFSKRLSRYESNLEKVRNLAEVIIAKQRHGPIGTVLLHFDGAYTRFSNHVDDDRLPDLRG